MSGVLFLAATLIIATAGVFTYWWIDRAPRRDPLGGVDEFERARRILRERSTPGGDYRGSNAAGGLEGGPARTRRPQGSTVRVIR